MFEIAITIYAIYGFSVHYTNKHFFTLFSLTNSDVLEYDDNKIGISSVIGVAIIFMPIFNSICAFAIYNRRRKE